MAFPRIPRHWRLRTLMIAVAISAAGLVAYREYVDRGTVYRQIWRLRAGNPQARAGAALRLGLMGPRASIAVDALNAALDDPDPGVRFQATYALVRHGSRSSHLMPVLIDGIEHTPAPSTMALRGGVTWLVSPEQKGWPLSNGGLPYNEPVEALKRIQPPAALLVPMLGKVLKDPDFWVRRAARETLFAVATWSDPSSPELADALLAVLADDRSDSERRARQVDAVIQFEERKLAVQALAKLDRTAQRRAVAQLAADLRDLGSPRSYEAAWLLPRLAGGTPAVVSVLRDVVRDGADIHRLIALILLEPIGEAASPAAPTLMQAVLRPDCDRMIDINGRMTWWETLAWREERPEFSRRFARGTTRTRASTVELGVRALRAMGEPAERRAIGDLIAVVREPDGDLDRKRGAIVALGEFGPGAAGAIPVLVGLIREAEKSHRGPSWDPDHGASPGALATAAVGRIGSEGNPEALAVLAGLIEVPGALFGPNAAWALVELGPKARPAVPALVKALKDPQHYVRYCSCVALREIGGPEIRAVLPALIGALDDEDELVRINAAEAVGQFGADAKEAVPKIVDLLWDLGPRPKLASSLGRIGPDAAAAVPLLLFDLGVTHESYRGEISEALDRIMPRTPGATVAGSIAAMKASDAAVRSRAVYELGRLIEARPHPADGAAALGAALGDPDPSVRRMAAAMLCRLGPGAAPAGPAMIRAAGDPDESVRRLVTAALGRAAAELPGAIPALAGMMEDRSGVVRRWAADALATVGPPAAPAVPAMIAGLEGQDVATRAAILAALGKLARSHDSAIPALLRALDDPAAGTRIAASQALGEHVGRRRDVVMPALLKALDDPSQGVRFTAGRSLASSRPVAPVLPHLIERMKTGGPASRAAAAGALLHLYDAEHDAIAPAVAALTAALGDKDPRVRAAAAGSLRWFGTAARSAEPALRAAINDTSRSVRNTASDTLQGLARTWRRP